ncbi:MAG: hypothetical protein ACK55I_48055, partial [bacterium]
ARGLHRAGEGFAGGAQGLVAEQRHAITPLQSRATLPRWSSDFDWLCQKAEHQREDGMPVSAVSWSAARGSGRDQIQLSPNACQHFDEEF